jgi:transposase-like protein
LEQRFFSTDLKLQIIQRVGAGESVASIAKELNILRKSIYQWLGAYRELGVAGLNQKRGRKANSGALASARGAASSDAASFSAAPRAEVKPVDELSRAQARIAELERVIGRQQADLHFFREALRLWDEKSLASGARASTKSSKK